MKNLLPKKQKKFQFLIQIKQSWLLNFVFWSIFAVCAHFSSTSHWNYCPQANWRVSPHPGPDSISTGVESRPWTRFAALGQGWAFCRGDRVPNRRFFLYILPARFVCAASSVKLSCRRVFSRLEANFLCLECRKFWKWHRACSIRNWRRRAVAGGTFHQECIPCSKHQRQGCNAHTLYKIKIIISAVKNDNFFKKNDNWQKISTKNDNWKKKQHF